jgi:hypothetical protein
MSRLALAPGHVGTDLPLLMRYDVLRFVGSAKFCRLTPYTESGACRDRVTR